MTILTNYEIMTLNAARLLLGDIERRAMAASWDASPRVEDPGPRPADLGRLAEAASRAEDAVFDALNVAACVVWRSRNRGTTA